jgi:hypothetical protein
MPAYQVLYNYDLRRLRDYVGLLFTTKIAKVGREEGDGQIF